MIKNFGYISLQKEDETNTTITVACAGIVQAIWGSKSHDYKIKLSCDDSEYDFKDCNIIINRQYGYGGLFSHWSAWNRAVEYRLFDFREVDIGGEENHLMRFNLDILVALVRMNIATTIDRSNDEYKYKYVKIDLEYDLES